jgi:nucleotide-binding universal stress UspA family protein
VDQGQPGGRIVAGMDGSPGGAAAVIWAIDEAAHRGAEVEAAYGWQIPALAYEGPAFEDIDRETLEAEGVRLLEEALALAPPPPGVPVGSRVYEGRPADVLRRAADEPDVVLLVVGRRGHGELAGLVLGSVSHELSHRSPKPLVIVPKVEDSDVGSPPEGRVLVGVDGSAGGDAALQWAAQEAQFRGATLEVVTAWSAPARIPLRKKADLNFADVARQVLDKAVAQVGGPGLEIDGRVLEGGAGPVLAERSENADLLVVGHRGLSRAKEALLGSVSHHAVHHSRAPVAIIPS